MDGQLVSYGRCTMPGSPMVWSERLSRRWAGYVLPARNSKKNAPLHASGALMVNLPCLDHPKDRSQGCHADDRSRHTWSRLIRVTELHLTDEACAMNVCAIKIHMNLFRTVCKPIWRLNRLYLSRDACANVPISMPASRPCIAAKLPIKLYISNTTTVLHGQKQSWE